MDKEQAKTKIYKDWVSSTENTIEVEIIDLIIEEAYAYWERANCVSDFCVQHIGLGGIVFGGSNRLCWSFTQGFRIDKSYCSENFLKANEKK